MRSKVQIPTTTSARRPFGLLEMIRTKMAAGAFYAFGVCGWLQLL
jgi:hypothetical protein